MMTDRQSGGGGIFGGYPQPGIQGNPYMNYNPAFVTPSPASDFILPEGHTGKRGALEQFFSHVGVSVMMGSAVGGLYGLTTRRGVVKSDVVVSKNRLARLLSKISPHTEQAGRMAQQCGTLAVFCSASYLALNRWGGTEDYPGLNTIGAATMTGALYPLKGVLNSEIQGIKRVLPLGKGAAAGFLCGVILFAGQYYWGDRVNSMKGTFQIHR